MAKKSVKFTFLREPDGKDEEGNPILNRCYVSAWKQGVDYRTVEKISGMKSFATKAERCRCGIVNLHSIFVDGDGKEWTGEQIVKMLGIPENPKTGFAAGFCSPWSDFEKAMIDRMANRGVKIVTKTKFSDNDAKLPGWPATGTRKPKTVDFDCLSASFDDMSQWESTVIEDCEDSDDSEE